MNKSMELRMWCEGVLQAYLDSRKDREYYLNMCYGALMWSEHSGQTTFEENDEWWDDFKEKFYN